MREDKSDNTAWAIVSGRSAELRRLVNPNHIVAFFKRPNAVCVNAWLKANGWRFSDPGVISVYPGVRIEHQDSGQVCVVLTSYLDAALSEVARKVLFGLVGIVGGKLFDCGDGPLPAEDEQ